MKKKLLLLMIVVSLGIFVNGCGNGQTENSGEDSAVEEALENAAEEVQEETKVIEETIQQFEELLSLEGYETFGNAFGGGVIALKKDGLWGAINYQNEEIVPFQYTGLVTSPTESGHFIFSNSTMETKEYFLFDSTGKVIYSGPDSVTVSGGMYIVKHEIRDDFQNTEITYYKMDGTEVLRVLCDPTAARVNGFKDGISTVYNSPIDNIEESQIGTVDLEGNVTWVVDPLRIKSEKKRAEWEASQQNEQEIDSMWEANTGGAFMDYSPRSPLNTMNYGYYVTNNMAYESGWYQLYDANYNEVCEFSMDNVIPDAELGFVIDYEKFNFENYSFRGYNHDGDTYYNYGTKMVFVLEGQDILVDFSKQPGMTKDTMTDSIIQAVYDKIYMGESKCWLAYEGDKALYIDHDGNVVEEYVSATRFYEGTAAVVRDGQAYIINEDFEEIQCLGEADAVGYGGELVSVLKGDVWFLWGRK